MVKPNPHNLAESLTEPCAIEYSKLKITTLNLFNYLEPPNAFYDFDRIYSKEQWHKKQTWISTYLANEKPDVIGFQEVFSSDSLQKLLRASGYEHYGVVDQPMIIDEFIYRSPVVALASKFPINEIASVEPCPHIVERMGLAKGFTFNRKVLRATIKLPHIGNSDFYVVHFKSKRPLFTYDEQPSLSAEQNNSAYAQNMIVSNWGSSLQRGSEATLLLADMIARRGKTNYPMILLGDFNNELNDGILSQLVSHNFRSGTPGSNLEQDTLPVSFTLTDAWDLFVLSDNYTDSINRKPTHYYGAKQSVLDYVLLSEEFNPKNQLSIYEVSDYYTYDKHLINPSFDVDGESTDHGVVNVTLSLRE